jgi:hypothetical protein
VILLENIQPRAYIEHINPVMIFSFSDNGKSLNGTVEYNSLLYKKETIETIIVHFKHLLREVLSNIELQPAHVDILTAEEKEKLLFEFNNTGTVYPKNKTIVDLFRGQVEKREITSTFNRFKEKRGTSGSSRRNYG